ncbi:hypothetical protein MTP99_003422 [Tenebrio molitor]|nr:hypothetical protein MTP99_003422 [Tenebrio molitor]
MSISTISADAHTSPPVVSDSSRPLVGGLGADTPLLNPAKSHAPFGTPTFDRSGWDLDRFNFSALILLLRWTAACSGDLSAHFGYSGGGGKPLVSKKDKSQMSVLVPFGDGTFTSLARCLRTDDWLK